MSMREAHGISERRACILLGADRSMIRYRSTRPDDADLRARLRALARERRRFGYRRLGLLLAREGLRLNHKKLRRLYREERLQVRRRGGRKRAIGPALLSQVGYVSESQALPGRLRVEQFFDYLRPCYPTWDSQLELQLRKQLRLPPARRINALSHGMRLKST